MKSQKIRVRNLPETRRVIHKVQVKPTVILSILLFVGLLMMFMKPYLLVAGLTMVLLALFCQFVMPDRVLCEFCDDYMVLYNDHDRTRCNMIYYDEIVAWRYERHRSADQLVIQMIDDTTQVQEMYSKNTIRRQMETYAAGKERNLS